MNRKLTALLIALCSCGWLMAQKKDSVKVKTVEVDVADYDLLFDELDDFLDSLLTPRSYTLVNVYAGANFYDYAPSATNQLQNNRRLTLTPSVGYFSKTGLGINATANVVNEKKGWNPFQLATALSYDYLKNFDFAAGISATHFFTKKAVDFYTSPLKNEVYGYFTYRKHWLKPVIAASYGWGSRTSYEEREEYIKKLRLRKKTYTVVTTSEESISDFNLMLSARHDFYWLDLLNSNSFLRFTPQLGLIAGTQKFGFNQSSDTYQTQLVTGKTKLQGSENTNLDDQSKFQLLSVIGTLKSEFSLGKFFVQPQLAFNYYIPATNNNLATIFSINTGVIF
jgi:hypothetical protein